MTTDEEADFTALVQRQSRFVFRVAILGIPEGTARTRLQRARQVLRQKIANVHAQPQETRYAR